MSLTIEGKFNTKLPKYAMSELTKSANDIATDLVRVSMSLAPKSTGQLERSASSHITASGSTVNIAVSFTARSTKGFNYARKMHDGKYKLGKESQRKKPVRSKFSKKRPKVGPGYLSNPVEYGREGYANYIHEKTLAAITDNKVFIK